MKWNNEQIRFHFLFASCILHNLLQIIQTTKVAIFYLYLLFKILNTRNTMEYHAFKSNLISAIYLICLIEMNSKLKSDFRVKSIHTQPTVMASTRFLYVATRVLSLFSIHEQNTGRRDRATFQSRKTTRVGCLCTKMKWGYMCIPSNLRIWFWMENKKLISLGD